MKKVEELPLEVQLVQKTALTMLRHGGSDDLRTTLKVYTKHLFQFLGMIVGDEDLDSSDLEELSQWDGCSKILPQTLEEIQEVLFKKPFVFKGRSPTLDNPPINSGKSLPSAFDIAGNPLYKGDEVYYSRKCSYNASGELLLLTITDFTKFGGVKMGRYTSKSPSTQLIKKIEATVDVRSILWEVVSTIQFADNSDYLTALYTVVRGLTGIKNLDEEVITSLYRKLQPDE